MPTECSLATRRPMTIVHAVRQYLPGVGGIETYVSQLAQAQVLAGHRVRVLTLNKIFDGDGETLCPSESIMGVEVVRIAFTGSRRYPLAPGILKHLSGADIVHVHGIEFFADFLAWTRRFHRVPLLISTHGGFFHTAFARRFKQIWFGSVTRWTLGHYSAVLASSQQDWTNFARLVGGKAILLENAIDTDRFAGLAKRGAKTLIYFGRLAPNKRLDRLISWFATLVERVPEWRLVIAGKEMGTRVDDLQNLALASGVSDKIRFHRHPSDTDLRDLIGQCSVYVGASSYEGFGIAAVEAIGAGLFPLLSDIAPFKRTIERVGYGLNTSFEPGADIDAFLTRLKKFEIDQTFARSLPNRLAVFQWGAVLTQIEHLYAMALAGEASNDRAPQTTTPDPAHPISRSKAPCV